MIAETYLRTNHHLASRRSSKESIAGKFNAGDDILTTRDPDLHFRMDAKAAGFYETAVFWQPPNQKTRSRRAPVKKARRICTGVAISFFNCPCRTGWSFMHG
jgi:hypothetical protein